MAAMKLGHKQTCILLGLAAALKLAASASPLTLAETGKATSTIVGAAGATASEPVLKNLSS